MPASRLALLPRRAALRAKAGGGDARGSCDLSAEQDRAYIVDFIVQDNPLAAIRMDETFSAAVGRLAEHPC
jgi:hypothetical protein